MLLAEGVDIRESRIALAANHPNSLRDLRLDSRGTSVRRSQSDGYRRSTCSNHGRLFVCHYIA
jgi:hypothetical protein